MSFKRYRIIFILIFMLTSDGTHNEAAASETTKTTINEMENAQSDNKEGRALFPRMEYTNEWTPVGRGDPLKDPTFDYMPPLLERVRYWAEGTSNKNKNDILLLGVPSKKQHSVKKEKFTYGPIKRTYYSMPYQSHFSSPHHHQQQQYQQHPQRMMSLPHHMHVTSDPHSMMSTQHYINHHHRPPPPAWNNNNNNNIHHTELRQESSIHHKTVVQPILTTVRPSSVPFLPTIPPSSSTAVHLSSTPTSAMSFVSESETTTMSTINGHRHQQSQHISSSSSSSKETTKPLLHSILQTETAAPFSFTMKPSSIYQIEYTSNIFSPQAINSMATSPAIVPLSSSSPTKPSVRPTPVKTTTMTTAKMTISTAERDEQKHYVQPDMQSAWPVYNLIIEGHSKVKTYGLKNDDPLAASMPKIRPIQPKENPIVERRTGEDERVDEGPEFRVKSQQPKQQQKSTMQSLLSLLDGSFDNFLQDDEKKSKVRKTRSVTNLNNHQESVVAVSFQVNEQPQIYRRGTVISESLWPFENADTSRSR